MSLVVVVLSKNWVKVSSSKRASRRDRVFQLKGDKCYRCGGNATTVDHIIPDSAGGSHSIDNLEPCCVDCNSRRGNKPTGDGRYGARLVLVITDNYTSFTDYVSDKVNKNVDIVISQELLSNAIGYNYNASDLVVETYLALIKKARLITTQCNVFIHISSFTLPLQKMFKDYQPIKVYLHDDEQGEAW